MNTLDILFYGDKTVQDAIKDFPENEKTTPGVCGVWSTKDVLAHLTSYEIMLQELIASFIKPHTKTPTLNQMNRAYHAFNAKQVNKRKHASWETVVKEYNTSHADVMKKTEQLPKAILRKTGTLPWYGKQYSLDDLIVYKNYGHKQEHCAQIMVFRDRIKQ